MIVVRCPLRISLIGGGTDIPDFYKNYTGAALTFTISKYVYIIIKDLFDTNAISLKYSKSEYVTHWSQIQHPYFREVCRKYNLMGVEIVSLADIPSGSGLGSSAAFSNSLIYAANLYLGNTCSRNYVARESTDLEIGLLKKKIGVQDNYSTAMGGFRYWNFKEKSTTSKKLKLSSKDRKSIENNCRLIFCGSRHQNETKTAQITIKSLNSETISNLVSYSKESRIAYNKFVNEGAQSLKSILDTSWRFKKLTHGELNSEKTQKTMSILEKIGGFSFKLLGSGKGGFVFIYTPRVDYLNKVERAGLSLTRFTLEESGLTVIE